MKKIQVRTDTRLKDLEDKYTGLYPATCLSGSRNLGSWNLLPGWNRVGSTCTVNYVSVWNWKMKIRLLYIITIKCKIYRVNKADKACKSVPKIVLSEKYNEIFFLKTVYIPNTVEGNEWERQTTGKHHTRACYLEGFCWRWLLLVAFRLC